MSLNRFTTGDGTSLAYEDTGSGAPVIWQHGLTGDHQQTAEVFPAGLGLRRITLECRGHGESALGEPAHLSIAQFAIDVIALMDHLAIEQAVVGGISMGAAVSLRLAVTMPSRMRALILARPAWMHAPAPGNMRPFLLVAHLLKNYRPAEALRRFEQSNDLAVVEAESPDNAATLRGLFAREPQSTIELLARIPSDGLGVSRDEIAAIALPTLIVANAEDFIHPLAYAMSLSQWIPGAALERITSKSVDKPLYIAQFRTVLATFLRQPGVTQAGVTQ